MDLGYSGLTPNLRRSVTAGEENLAADRPAQQISHHAELVAGRAVDGRRDTGSCTETAAQPWWAVDLADEHDIGRVIVTADAIDQLGKSRVRRRTFSQQPITTLHCIKLAYLPRPPPTLKP